MNNITADHLARRACVYVRQSTPGQVQNNLESQRRQYALVDRARSLGWQDIDVIDDDLGISGSGTHRPGFEKISFPLCAQAFPTSSSPSRSKLRKAIRSPAALNGPVPTRVGFSIFPQQTGMCAYGVLLLIALRTGVSRTLASLGTLSG